MKAIIFARVSSKEQEDGQSIPAQVRRLTEYALRKNFTITETFQITESSTKETRKQFDSVIAYVQKSKEPIALITDTVDRLQRTFRETPLLDELRRQGKLEMHFLRESLIINKSSNSAQLIQWDMGVLVSSSYVRQMSDNVRRSQEQCIKNGQWISRAPYGYQNVSLPSGQKSIIINEEQAHFVRMAFELYVTGAYSYQTVADVLQKNGFALTGRGKSATDRTIELILNNPFYMGMMNINGELRPHKYDSIISEWMFREVQTIIDKHHKKPVQYARKPILLRGLMRCSHCDGTVSGYIKKGKYVYYSCHNSRRKCKKKCFTETEIMDVIMSHFRSIQLTNKEITEIGDYVEQTELRDQTTMQSLYDAATRRLSVVTERISRLIDMYADGLIQPDAYRLKLNEYERERSEATCIVQSHSAGGKTERVAAEEILKLAQHAEEIYESSSFEEKRQLLGFMFSNFRLGSEKIDVELRFPFSTMPKLQDQHIWRD